ncbi:MAG: DNA internalization-related competence protein ComEC/Rec2 [Deltaproteobacteria bacterium]|nr:DNA internalization-related competence protein ComEC/Rec2 [Deltaproteobacteria bacterium]
MQKPIIPLLIAIIAGIIIGNYTGISNTFILSFSLAALILLFFSFIRMNYRLLFFGLLFLLFLFGILNTRVSLYQKPAKNDISLYTGHEVVIHGLVCKSPETSPSKTSLIIEKMKIIQKKEVIPVVGRVSLSVKNNLRTFEYGDYIKAKTRLRRPHNFNNPGGFDYKRYLHSRGISALGSIRQPSNIVVLRKNRGSYLKTKIERYRSHLRRGILDMSPSPEGSILQALILGEKKGVPEDIREKFNRTGISHMLAISGLHIGIIATLFFFLAAGLMKSSEYLLLRFNIKKASALFVVIPIVGYAFISGLGISTIRATIMILSFLAALLLGRERDLLNTLAFAALIILIFSPSSLFDISFQLSFIAVTAILVITPTLNALFSRKSEGPPSPCKKILSSFFLFLAVSISAIAGTAPLIAFYFNRISTVTLISNVFIIPLLGFLVLPAGIVFIISAPLSTIVSTFMIKFASFFVGISLSIIDVLASFSIASFSVTTPTIMEIIVYYLFVITTIKLVESVRTGKKSVLLQIVLAVIVIFFLADISYVNLKGRNPNHLTATFIDVGQGNASLIEFPGGRKMLVDGGGFYTKGFDVGKYVVAPFLWRQRIKKLDIVVLTHPDQDHLGGLVYILNNFDVGEVWSNGEKSALETYRYFAQAIREHNVPHRIISRKTPDMLLGDTVIKILNPPEPIVDKETGVPTFSSNDNGLVMKITFRNASILLPADISEEVEKRLVMSGDNLKSNVILAPHHGSYRSSSPSFLERVRPDIVVVSCGFENVAGFPHNDAIERYEQSNARIFRTDLDGAVIMKTDGEDIEITSQRPSDIPNKGQSYSDVDS